MNQPGASYQAKCEDPQFEGGVADGRIVFDRWALKFVTDDATLTLLLRGLRLRVGGKDDERVFFEHPDHPDCCVFTWEMDILNDAALHHQFEMRKQIKEIKDRNNGLRIIAVTAAFFVGFAVVSVAGYWLAARAVDAMVMRVPASWETNFGASVITEALEGMPPIITNDARAAGVQALTDRLLASDKPPFPYQVQVLDEYDPNAFALPGGYIFVTAGLFDVMTNDVMMSGVLAHEIAHIRQRHGMRQLVAAGGPLLIFQLLMGTDDSLLGVLGESSALLTHLSYSRVNEQEADDLGWQYLLDANVDPRGLIEGLRALEAGAPQPFGPRGFASHPATRERIRRLEDKWRNLEGKE